MKTNTTRPTPTRNLSDQIQKTQLDIDHFTDRLKDSREGWEFEVNALVLGALSNRLRYLRNQFDHLWHLTRGKELNSNRNN